VIRRKKSYGSQIPFNQSSNMIGLSTVREKNMGATCQRAPNGGSNPFALSSNPSGQYNKLAMDGRGGRAAEHLSEALII